MNARSAWALVAALAAAGCSGGLDEAHRGELRNGERLYLTYGCGACHGTDGRGEGPAAKSLGVAPRNLRSAEAFRHGRSTDAIARTIAEGVPAAGGGMPASPYIPLEERRLLAKYVRSLAPAGSGDGKD